MKKVLIVDDDPEMLSAIREGLDRYSDTFAVLTAENGKDAINQLKQHYISVVVTDLKMPELDGFGLLAHTMDRYPDIPVIFITGYGTAEMKKMARQDGAVSYISKPFLIENLARKIIATLRKESEGGTLHGVSSGIFLQLIEMEERTCTIRLTERTTGLQGVLFFREGELLDARVGDLQGIDAAYRILGWENVSLSIQNGCPKNDNIIQEDLQAIILEAMRRKDEASDHSPGEAGSGEPEPLPGSDAAGGLMAVRDRVETELGSRSGIVDAFMDDEWDDLMLRGERIGEQLGVGHLLTAYLDTGDANHYVLVPGEPTGVIAVSPKCPRDRILPLVGWR